MRILLTGASSFTGFWFARALVQAGHEVVAVLRRRPEEYPDAVRRARARMVCDCCQTVCGPAFGDEAFLKVIEQRGPWHILAHHAADVTNYRSPDFDVMAAVANNTRGIQATLAALSSAGCRHVLLTGSVFENDEGAGSEGLEAFSPYGLSKAITAQIFRYYTRRAGMVLGKFVIPNPFGPYEEPRFTAYLMKNWLARKPATVNTPAYVRDNIHVSLLAAEYVRFAAELAASTAPIRINPSGYVESQGAFAMRFAREIGRRLNLPCELVLKEQTEFIEPRVRINTDLPKTAGWSESAAWDQIAEYYAAGPPT
jgi:UDP-glucose 4-epimerase